ncbi:SART-1 protein [Scheffersomyces amazonensis]|uniref:SART-1 protein n=1 Tax=Scheffersomyces amazonensis TaxID=1078765 RepID=UPI00315CD88A
MEFEKFPILYDIMAQEIVLSVAETNVLRAKVGLPLIPTENDSESVKQEVNEPIPVTSATYELSIEETNKLRISIGLAPIPVESHSLSSSEVENQRNHEQALQKSQRNEELKSRITQAKTKSHTRKALSGKTLTEDFEPISTSNWLDSLGQNNSKSQSQSQSKSSTAKSLKSKLGGTSADIKVGHSLKELQNLNENDILTLDDNGILDSDNEVDATLTNERLSNSKRLKKELEERAEAENIKFNGRHSKTTPLFGEEDEGEQDENDNSGVILGAGSTITFKQSTEKPEPSQHNNKLKLGQLFDEIDPDNDGGFNVASDYAKPKKALSMKKLKKKVKSQSKTITSVIDDDEGIPKVKLNRFDDEENEEEQLQKMLEESRRKKQKRQRSEMTPEDIANEVTRLKRQELQDTEDDERKAIFFNDTSDFLHSLSRNILTGDINGADNDIEDDLFKSTKVKKEEHDEYKSIVKQEETPIDLKTEEPNENENENEIQDDTPQFNNGLASTLKFLQSRNILEKSTNEDNEQERKRQETIKEAEMLQIKISIEERILREQLESDKKYLNLPKSERGEIFDRLLDEKLTEKGIIKQISHHNQQHQQKYSKYTNQSGHNIVENKLKSYNPKVTISYHDDGGNTLNTREAFKYLSHQFHGVGPSRPKQEKLKQQRQRQKHQTEPQSQSPDISSTNSGYGKIV